MEVREFSTFAPAAIAMIGHLPGTLADRSIAITLKRKRVDEPVESFRYDHTEELDQLARMCARWAADNIELLRRADPDVPANLYNRAADNWRPLLAIADAAGGDWPQRAREIAAATVDADQAKRVGLLADIHDVFEAKRVDKIKSAELALALVAIEGHPWAEYGKSGKPLSANNLARMLAGDHVIPKTVRFGAGPEDTAKGYELDQFADAFARYLPPPQNPTVTPSQPLDFCGFSGDAQPSQHEACYGLEIAQNTSVSATCDGVTVEKPEEPPKSERVRVRL
jgi:putative DNA primase/helicase